MKKRRIQFRAEAPVFIASLHLTWILELCLKGVTHIFPTPKSDQPQWYCKVSNRTQVLGSMSGRKVAIISCSPLNPGNELSSPPTTSTGPNTHCQAPIHSIYPIYYTMPPRPLCTPNVRRILPTVPTYTPLFAFFCFRPPTTNEKPTKLSDRKNLIV